MADIPEEYKTLIETLQKMKLTPKADNPEEFQAWITQFAGGQGASATVKKEPSTIPYQSSQPPRLNNFSGSIDKKGETTYQLWRYEVQGLMRDKIHSEEAIIQAIRRSLRSDAGMVAMRLGPQASLAQIMEKMESVFGNVDDTGTILSEFYNAKQKDDEDVAAWSCRLESILDRAIQSGKVEKKQSDEMLHDMLWKGLKPDMKDISHFEKERHISFNDLQVSLRRLEKEYQFDHPAKKATVKQAIATEEPEESELAGVLKQITTRLEKLETGQQYQDRQPYQQQQRSYGSQQQRPYGSQQQQRQGNYRGRGRGFNPNQQTPSTYPVMTCRRCGQPGHLARGCVQNLDIHGKPLNMKQSSTRGGR